MRVMLFRLYQMKYRLPSRRIVKSDELHAHNHALPRFLITNGHYSYEGAVGKLFEVPDAGSELRQKKVMLVVRHPCDIAVSWYLQFMKRTKAYKRELIAHAMNQPIRRGEVSMWDFVMHPEIGLPALIEYFNGWQRKLSQLDNRLVVRYEDLRARPADTLKRITSFMGEPFTDDAIDEAVAFGSFDNLKELEKTNFFSNAGLSLRDPSDPDSFKVRRGKVGGYRDYFGADQVAEMEELVRERLSPAFGYGRIEPALDRAAGP